MNDGYQGSWAQGAGERVARNRSVQRQVIRGARDLAEKLNGEIGKGNDVGAFTIALSLALCKDFLDILLTVFLVGLIPGVSFLLGLFLTSFLFFFMLGKGWLLRWRLKFWFGFFGLFIDGLPLLNTLPTNTLLVLYAWRIVKKRAAKATLKLRELDKMTNYEIEELNSEITLLESSYYGA